MHKNTPLISGFLVFCLVLFMLPFLVYSRERNPIFDIVCIHLPKEWLAGLQDKNLLKGNWQNEEAAVELHISKLLKNGGLEVKYLNSKSIFIEKAGWTNSSDVLRVFVIYREEGKPGYSLALNYIAEKDLLVGEYVDGLNNRSFNVTFKRIK